MAEPNISVVIPTRNRVEFIQQALDSVFAQTYKSYEIIVVDDGSTDSTRETLDSLARQKTIRYEYQEPLGVSAARNRGVSLARGQYIAFLDSDDLFLPTKLQAQMRVFEGDPSLGFVHCSFSKFNNEGRDLGIRDTSRFQGKIYPWMLQEWSVLMAMPCMLVRTDVMREVGGFDETMVWAEDMDLWRRIAKRYRIGTVPEVLVKVRAHPSSTTFEKSGAVEGFKHYLDKAFADDPALRTTFRKRSYAKMYTKLAQNLLGEGGPVQMQLVRQHTGKALDAWPLQASAIFAFFASFLPSGLRHRLANLLRSNRYPSG